jgi:hypothetical protein
MSFSILRYFSIVSRPLFRVIFHSHISVAAPRLIERLIQPILAGFLTLVASNPADMIVCIGASPPSARHLRPRENKDKPHYKEKQRKKPRRDSRFFMLFACRVHFK